MDLTFQQGYQRSSFGDWSYGISVQIATPKDIPLTEEQRSLITDRADKLLTEVMADIARHDPGFIERAAEERRKILECFGGAVIHVREIENGYDATSWHQALRPWFRVTTPKGPITIGWRKKVIEIDWTDSDICEDADVLFHAENVTKVKKLIHAWGYENARRYLANLMRPPL